MKNLIYQYWNGNVRPSARYGSDCMREYAHRIGAVYKFDVNSNFPSENLGRVHKFYGCFKPVFDDSFLDYDNVLFVDTDVFPVEGLSESIFEAVDADLAMATEPLQPLYRYDNTLRNQCNQLTEEAWANIVTNKWGCKLPIDQFNRYKVYNSGVVLYSRAGLKKCREQFIPFKEYVKVVEASPIVRGKVYSTDQGYIHAMATCMDINFQELDNEWNRLVTWDPYSPKGKKRKAVDPKTRDTKFVHVQMRGADNMDDHWHWTVVNRPKSEWGTMRNGTIIE